MTATRDPDRLIRAFLSEGQTELPDRAYEHVRHTIDRTRQRVVVGPWREPRMSSFMRAAVAVAAVVVAAVVGFDLGPGPGVGGPTPPPPSASRGPGASPSTSPGGASSSPLAYGWPQTLAAGSYSTSLSWDPFYKFRFTVPEGWQSRDINIVKGETSLMFYFVDNVAANPCSETAKSPSIDGSVDALVAALPKLVKLSAGPAPVTVGDRPGKYVEFTVRTDVGCAAGSVRLFKLSPQLCLPGCGGLGPPWRGIEFGRLPEHYRMWILTVGRTRGVINAVWTDQATAADLGELQGVIDSMRFDTPTATALPQPESISPSP
jgi:hypothetical protein